jgi:acyl-CoA thioesterase I
LKALVHHSVSRRYPFLLLAVLAGCGGGSPSGPTQQPPLPQLTCPAPVTAMAHDGQDPEVTYDPPTPSGGQAPVTVTCTPVSGQTFPLGTSTVTCTAVDSLARRATCSFPVLVEAVPRLIGEDIVAFGDSLTEGVTSPRTGVLVLNLPESYPRKLQTLVSLRYVDQNAIVLNEGKAGEPAIEEGTHRLERVLREQNPDLLLLMHGANDLLARRPTGSIAEAIDEMVAAAQRRGTFVILAGLPPQIPGRQRSYAIDDLAPLNDAIRRVAASEGVPFIDMVAEFGSDLDALVGEDGLHLRPDGYQRMAEIWLAAIAEHFEQASMSPAPSALTVRR